MKCPYVKLVYDKTYNQWYGYDEFGTNTTISNQYAEEYKRTIPFTIVASPDVYQQRLDKVLSKLQKTSSDEFIYRDKDIYNDYWFTYSKELQSFFFGNTYKVISLETVESLLADLEQ